MYVTAFFFLAGKKLVLGFYAFVVKIQSSFPLPVIRSNHGSTIVLLNSLSLPLYFPLFV